MSVAPGSTRRIIAPHNSQYLAPPHVLRSTVLLNAYVAHCERWSTAPLPPVVTPTPASITPMFWIHALLQPGLVARGPDGPPWCPGLALDPAAVRITSFVKP